MFHFTMQAARISCGYTVEEVARHCKISIGEYLQIEHNPRRAESYLVALIISLFGVPLDLIFLGSAPECAKHNRQRIMPTF